MSERVTGQALTIQFDGQKCIHSRNCVLSLPQVFRANVEGPWIHPDAASPDAVAALAARCPSGAIVVERHDGVPDELPSGRNVIAVLESGPYAVRGELSIGGDRTLRATLCRCGASKNKPYCDHSHVDAGFAAPGELPPPPSVGDWGEAGPLTVTPLKDGPLKVDGAHEVTSGSGRTNRRAAACFLCRCGASNNKPYCDGSHRAAGFTSG